MVASFLQGQMESQSLKLLSEGAKPEQRPDGLRLTLREKPWEVVRALSQRKPQHRGCLKI